ncbi:hypothetical protein T439DRAFT_337344 [Meredithblackwellia eburnea MCA 4105]
MPIVPMSGSLTHSSFQFRPLPSSVFTPHSFPLVSTDPTSPHCTHTHTQILQLDWPNEWPTFIDDLLASCTASSDYALCENSLVVLRLLSEAIHENGWEMNLSEGRWARLREALVLSTTAQFLTWISPDFVESSPVFLESLGVALLWNELKCDAMLGLGLIFSLLNEVPLVAREERDKVADMLDGVLGKLDLMMRRREGTSEKEGPFFLTITRANEYLLQISLNSSEDTLLMCLDNHWIPILGFITDGNTVATSSDVAENGINEAINRLSLNGTRVSERRDTMLSPAQMGESSRRMMEWFAPLFAQLRELCLARMISPSVEQSVPLDQAPDDGTVRELFTDGSTVALHTSLRDVIVGLSLVDWKNMLGFIRQKIDQAAVFPLRRTEIEHLVWFLAALATRHFGEQVIPRQLCDIDLQSHKLGDTTDWFREALAALQSMANCCTTIEERMFMESMIIFLLGRFPDFLNENPDYLALAIQKIFELLKNPEPIPPRFINNATDSFEIIAYFNRARICQRVAPLPSLAERILMNERPMVSQIYGSSLGVFLAAAAAVTAGPTPLHEALYQSLRLYTSVSSTLKGGFMHTMKEIGPALAPLYESTSRIIAAAVAKDCLPAAQHVTVRWLRRVRRQVILLAIMHGSGISIDSSAPNIGSEGAGFRKAITSFAREILPPLADAAIGDFMRSSPELREVEIMDLMDQSLNNLGGVLSKEWLVEVSLSVIKSAAQYVESGDYHLYRFACSTRLIRAELLSEDMQQALLELVLYGMKVFNRDVAKNALVMAYHFFGSYHPIIAVPTAFEKSVATAPNDSFLAMSVEPILNSVWEVMTDSEHKNTFENQSPVVARIFNILSQSAAQVLPPDRYAVGETNKEWLRRWFLASLQKAFPQLETYGYSLFSDIMKLFACPFLINSGHSPFIRLPVSTNPTWNLVRRTCAEEDHFGAVLRDFFLDLAQFRKSDNRELFLKKDETTKGKETTMRFRIPSLREAFVVREFPPSALLTR